MSKTKEKCDLCGDHGIDKPAAYDARIPYIGSWAFLCEDCFKKHNCQLGIGRGQRLE